MVTMSTEDHTHPLKERVRPGEFPMARWPHKLGSEVSAQRIASIQAKLAMLERAAQYGWGHTIDFGSFTKQGVLGENFLAIAGLLDEWGWWPRSLDGWSTADVGCFTGGLSLLMADRSPRVVYAVDEVGEHLDQCAFLCEVFGISNLTTIQCSVYGLCDRVEACSLDLVVLSGVLYHLSDMLLGLYVLRRALKPGGTLILESNAVNDDEQSYANFGRFYAGMWWQPSTLCIRDMCEYMGFERPEVRFYKGHRCLARTLRTEEEDIPFKRGLNWEFDSIRDARPRPLEAAFMAPVRRSK